MPTAFGGGVVLCTTGGTMTTPSQNKVPLYGGVARSAGVVSRAYARTTSTL